MEMKKYFENRIETLQNKRTELKNGIENLSAEEIKDRFSQIDNIDTEIADCKAQLTEIENAWQAQQNISFTPINGEKTIIKAKSKDEDDIIAAILNHLRSKNANN